MNRDFLEVVEVFAVFGYTVPVHVLGLQDLVWVEAI